MKQTSKPAAYTIIVISAVPGEVSSWKAGCSECPIPTSMTAECPIPTSMTVAARQVAGVQARRCHGDPTGTRMRRRPPSTSGTVETAPRRAAPTRGPPVDTAGARRVKELHRVRDAALVPPDQLLARARRCQERGVALGHGLGLQHPHSRATMASSSCVDLPPQALPESSASASAASVLVGDRSSRAPAACLRSDLATGWPTRRRPWPGRPRALAAGSGWVALPRRWLAGTRPPSQEPPPFAVSGRERVRRGVWRGKTGLGVWV